MSYEIINSDCLKAMQKMPDGSVDAIVTDPPYGLAFMGAKWDSFNGPNGKQTTKERQDEGRRYATENKGAPRYGNSHGKKVTRNEMVAFQEAMTPIFAEALRVAKPGAHMLCFGGTRTFHRLACSLEDAGWEIRDCIMWVYGCLDEETEILIDGEFVPYNKAKIGSLALGYDIERGTFSWQRIEDTYLYDYDDTAYTIQSDSTDQLVSRNHRCIVERGGVEQFAFAEQVAQEREASVPVLEGLQGLLDHLPLPHEGAGDEEQDVLEGVRGEGGESRAEEAQGARAEHDMPSMRERVLRADGVEAQGSDKLLLKELQGQGGKCTSTASVQQGTPDTHGGREKAEAKRADDWTSKPVMEGRGDISAQPRELQGCEVRQMPQGVLGYGTHGRVCDGAQACGGSGDREAADKAGMRASRQSRPVGQQAREPDAVPVERGAQGLRELWGAKSTLARVTPVHYKGKMWCVKVRTGAFVARRHGKIFITGNSGFPKSLDVGKAIDKHLGVKQKVVGHRETDPQKGFSKVKGMGTGAASIGDEANSTSYDLTEATSDEARQWDGWGTCLKPAWEPIIVARKPLDGTVAHNVMEYGTGAINIDGCRVPTEDKLGGGMRAGGADGVWDRPFMHDEKAQAEFVERKRANVAKSESLGRFPANLVHDGSQEVLELFPDSKGQQGKVAGNEPSRTGDNGIYGHYGQRNEFVPRGDSGSAARFFYCAKASKKDRGEGNDHPTVKPNALMRWLVRLVCPQGGTVLDPFMGSGSTGVACIQEGMRFVGIEMDEHYCEIAEKRIGAEPDTVFAGALWASM